MTAVTALQSRPGGYTLLGEGYPLSCSRCGRRPLPFTSTNCLASTTVLPNAPMRAAYRYIFEVVPNEYSMTEENLRRADALEVKIGQSAKPGLGGHLPGHKVTEEIARVRGSAGRRGHSESGAIRRRGRA